ncbi:hypothetical protein FRC00_010815 [Tulasnella sp. 408]|nr:hypothetical protein FRC00_010815 [Tulasnella sp. 408]
MAGKGSSKTLKNSKTAESEARALSIPELLSMVFSHSAKPELAISARVCKTWSDPALDELWKNLKNVFPLLQLVLDLDILRNDDGGHAFLEAKLYWFTSHSVLEMIPFLSEELLHLKLGRYNMNDSEVRMIETFKALRNRTLKVKTFRLDSSARTVDPASEAALAQWLETLEDLETIKLPPDYLTARILAALKALPRLRMIDQTTDPRHVHNNDGIVETLPENSFPSLVQLALPATLAAAQRFLFNSRTNFTGLAGLNLHSSKDINRNQVLAFTQHLANRCPAITTID